MCSLSMRAALAAALLGAALALVGCSPEEDRALGQAGADINNRNYPLPSMHGDRSRNNPSFETPLSGRVPEDARGVPGFWADPEQ
jgi:hypothetical protein